jgi:hypothetical protein
VKATLKVVLPLVGATGLVGWLVTLKSIGGIGSAEDHLGRPVQDQAPRAGIADGEGAG